MAVKFGYLGLLTELFHLGNLSVFKRGIWLLEEASTEPHVPIQKGKKYLGPDLARYFDTLAWVVGGGQQLSESGNREYSSRKATPIPEAELEEANKLALRQDRAKTGAEFAARKVPSHGLLSRPQRNPWGPVPPAMCRNPGA
jgi:hypothetical protein